MTERPTPRGMPALPPLVTEFLRMHARIDNLETRVRELEAVVADNASDLDSIATILEEMQDADLPSVEDDTSALESFKAFLEEMQDADPPSVESITDRVRGEAPQGVTLPIDPGVEREWSIYRSDTLDILCLRIELRTTEVATVKNYLSDMDTARELRGK